MAQYISLAVVAIYIYIYISGRQAPLEVCVLYAPSSQRTLFAPSIVSRIAVQYFDKEIGAFSGELLPSYSQ